MTGATRGQGVRRVTWARPGDPYLPVASPIAKVRRHGRTPCSPPDLVRNRLARWLPDDGIAYRWEPGLGGFRKPAPDSPDTFWRNDSFRGYAGYARTPEFVAATDRLLGEAAGRRTAVMCGEAVWWRCHRRLIADFAELARGMPVRHLPHDGRIVPHVPADGARLRPDGLLVHDGPPG
ncbi:DUF488 domain-containing protein [Streptomyces seoulensis]|nr:DUF488 domain-containing protein [Streptomyces seoulensis]